MQINTILRNFILGGVFVMPFIAFIVLGDFFFPYITGKNFTFRILTELIFGAWVLLAIRDARYRPKLTLPALALSMLVMVMGVSTLTSPDVSKSFWSNYERMDGYITLLHLFAYFWVLGTVLNTKRLWDAYFHTTIGASVLMVFYGLAQLFGDEAFRGGMRLTGTLGNAAYMASYMMFHIFLTGYYLLVYRGAAWVRGLYALIIAGQAYILYYTATRGAILGLIGGVIVVAFLIAVFDRRNKRRRAAATGVIAAVLLLVIGFILVKDTDFVRNSRVLNRFASISLQDNTTESRFLIWRMALEAAKEHPFLGWGYGNFTHVFNKYYVPEMYKNEPWFDRAHNVVFDWLVAGGILGLLAYVSIYLAVLYVLWKRGENDQSIVSKSALTGLLAAYVFQNLFVFDNIVSYMLFFMVLAYIHSNTQPTAFMARVRSAIAQRCAAILPSGRSGADGGDVEHPSDVTVIITVTVLTLSIVFILNYNPIAQNLALMKALGPAPGGNFDKKLEAYQKALAYQSFGTTEVRERLAIDTSNVIYRQDVPMQTRQRFVALALSELDKQREEIPQDVKYSIFKAAILNRIGRVEDARAELQEALKVSPHKEQVIFELIMSDLSLGKYDEALELARNLYEETPEQRDAAKLYAIASVYKEDFATADSVLLDAYGTTTIADQMFINAYAAVKDFDRVTRIWERIVAEHPERAQYRINLAASYIEIGERGKALDALREAKQIFEGQGDTKSVKDVEYYISEIEAGRTPK